MAGITNAAYRRLCREQGAGLYVCEMITSRGLVEGPRHVTHQDFAGRPTVTGPPSQWRQRSLTILRRYAGRVHSGRR